MLPEKRQRLDPSSSPLHPNCSSFNSNNPPSSSLSDLRGRFSVQAVDSPTSSPPYFTAPTQPQKQSQNYSTSSKNPSNSRQSSQDATVISENGSRPNHGFPKANMRPLTSFNAPSPPTPSTSQSLPETTQSLPLPSQTQSNLTDAQREKIKASKEAALARRNAKGKSVEQVILQVEGDPIKIKQERTEARRQLAATNLSKFGFTMASGISRYGSGKGGKVEPGEVAAAVPTIEEWKPDERCSEEQGEVLEQVKRGGNVFFTGSAGVGKSFLLNEITRLLEHLKRPFQITATTGIAALQVNGTTIHSWAAVGLGDKEISALYDKITRNKDTSAKNWRGIQTLIIDEISMSPPELFEKLNILGKLIRENKGAFGGLQLIVSGDFFQLPPVPEGKVPPSCMRCGVKGFIKIPLEEARLPYEERPPGVPVADVFKCVGPKVKRAEDAKGCLLEWRQRRFVFETNAWAECDFKVMELTKVFRQSDPDFIAVLEKIRRGICDQKCIDLFAACGSELKKGGAIKIRPTNLYPKRQAVDDENRREFKNLKEEEYVFEADDQSRGDWGATQLKRLDTTPAAKTLNLKEGAQVLLLANLDVKGGLVNGSRGVIVGWVSAQDVPDEESISAANGQGKKPGGAGRVGTEEWREKAADEFMDKQDKVFYPLVFFACGKEVLVRPHSWCIDLDKHNTVARTQIPLQLAWALTIHKSQGQSLDAVCVRLGNTFEKGQAYVALSRARTKEGLKVEGFRPGVVMAHSTVEIFYDCIAKKKPFFVSPVVPTNPLHFIPSFDPLIDKLSRIFGPDPPPLEQGSAVLVPGQRKPQHQSPPPTSTSNQPKLSKSKRKWQELLEEAAENYVETTNIGSGSLPMEPFLAVAGSSLLTALGKRQGRDGSVASTESGSASPMAIDGTGGEEGNGIKKEKKKKRSRKGRVGH